MKRMHEVSGKTASCERLPKPAAGAHGRNMSGVAFQMFPALSRALAPIIHV